MKRVLVTFVFDEHPILRVTVDGECVDYTLTINQVKLLIYQMVEWITKR